MSSGQVFPSLTTIDPGQMASTDAAIPGGTDPWYAQSSYAFSQDPNTAYMTPYPSSTVESQPWTQYARASVPDISINPYAMQPPQAPNQSPPTTRDPGRPRSSPSTFGPSADSIPWTSAGLGIQYTTAGGHPTPPVTSTFPPNVFTHFPTDESYTSSPPNIHAPQPVRRTPFIAPNPVGVANQKRKREDDEATDASGSRSKQQRKRTSSVASADLSEDDRFLVQLKEEENLPWKDIATRFQTDKGKPFQVAALQMRYKRLREKFRVWEEQDLQALKLAHEYWEKYKWEIISAKMLDFGIQERWPARHCARKWQEIEAAQHASALQTPQFSSPMQSQTIPTTAQHFAFIPNYHSHHQHHQQ